MKQSLPCPFLFTNILHNDKHQFLSLWWYNESAFKLYLIMMTKTI